MQVDQHASRELYERFINGQVINELIFHDSGMVVNPLFEELVSNFDRYYRELYLNIGFELVLKKSFAFIRSIEPDDAQNDIVRKVQGLLLILGRGVTELGFQFELLTNPAVGVSNEIIEQIEQKEDKQEVLAACDIKGGLLINIERILGKRNIAFQNAKANWVLSNAGMAFFDELFDDAEASGG